MTIEISTDEYALIAQPLVAMKDYFKPGTKLDKMVNQATSILKQASKRNGKPTPEGASYKFPKMNLITSDKVRSQRIKGLMQMFGVHKRIAR